MPHLTTRAPGRPPSSRSKLLILRQPVKSVRPEDHPDRTPLRLAIGVIVALGTVSIVWAVGFLGYRLGYAPLIRVPELLGEPGAGLATGTTVIISVPRLIFRAGLAQPIWLMIGFVMISIPAGGLAAAKPKTPGGPRVNPGVAAIAASGAVLAMISGAALIWWTSSPLRGDLLRVLPLDPAQVRTWHHDLQIVAGLDVLAVISAALWVVLVLRLPVQLWLRAVAGSAAFFTLVVVTVAMSISSTAATQAGATRSLCRICSASRAPALRPGRPSSSRSPA